MSVTTTHKGDKKEGQHEVGNESGSKLLDENQLKVEAPVYRLVVEDDSDQPERGAA
ncbi:MAG: hypothetical protein L7U83_10130 [Akkermansiaceae bacterium]|nr:hypothetical protein [Akkermansiaceae bacterium]